MLYITLAVAAVLGLFYVIMAIDYEWVLANQEKRNLAQMLEEMADRYVDQFIDYSINHDFEQLTIKELAHYVAIGELALLKIYKILSPGHNQHTLWLKRFFVKHGRNYRISAPAHGFKTVLNLYMSDRESIVDSLVEVGRPTVLTNLGNDQMSKRFDEARTWARIITMVDGDLRDGLKESDYLQERLHVAYR